MNKEEALKEARRLLKKSGVDTSEMTDAEVMAQIEAVIEPFTTIGVPIKEPGINDGTAQWWKDRVDTIKWWESLPEEVRAELKEG